jgi:hypothetical protein
MEAPVVGPMPDEAPKALVAGFPELRLVKAAHRAREVTSRGDRRVWRGLGIGLVMLTLLPIVGCARGTVQDALGMGKRSPDEFAVVKRAPLIVPPDFDLRPPEPGAPRPNVGSTADQARVALTGSRPEPSPAAQILAGTPPSMASQMGPGSSRQMPTAGVPGSVPAAAIADDLLSAGTNMPSDGFSSTATPRTATTAAATTGAPAGANGESPGERAMVALAGGDQADPDIRRVIAEENQALADVEASLFTRIVKWREPSTTLGPTVDAPAEAQRLRDNKMAGREPTAGDTPTVINRRQSALQGLLENIF